MAEVVLQRPHTFSLYGHARADPSANFYDDELSTDIETPDWFSFPTRMPGVANQPASRTQSSINVGTKPNSHQRSNHSLSALPAFSFNPSQSVIPSTGVSELHVPLAVSAPTTPARAGRHRRAASELIGGTARIGMCTNGSGSPTRQGTGTALPASTIPFGSLPSRLEHRHRRTDTLLSEDLAQGVCRPKLERNSSSQSSIKVVVGAEVISETLPHRDDEGSQSPLLPLAKPRIRSQELKFDTSSLPKSPSRHRVGFSDTLEFIPRPLSTISSESGSSMSTIRAHSISGSISSVMCSGAISPLSKVVTTPTKRSFDAIGTPSAVRPTNVSGDDVFASSPTTSDSQDHIQGQTFAGVVPEYSHQRYAERFAVDNIRIVLPTEAPKQRKVGPWNTLLGKKSKSDLPPHYSRATTETVEITSPAGRAGSAPIELSHDFDTDPTSIIISDSNGHDFTPPTTPPVTPNDRKKFNENCSATGSSSVIDLDAALCCDWHHDGRGPKGRSFSEARRSMHSNAVASGFLSSNVHRRADSAPTLTGVNFDPAGFRERNGSISSFKRPQMEDVFEEEEDDNPQKVVKAEMSIQSKVCLGVETHSSIGMDSPDADSLPTTPSDVTGSSSHLDCSSRRLRFDAPWKCNRDGRDDIASCAGPEPTEAIHNENVVADISVSSRNSGIYSKATNDTFLHKQRKSVGSDTFPLPNRYNSGFVLRTGSPLPTSNCGCGNDCSVFNRQDIGPTPGIDIRKAYAQSVGERGSEIRYSVDDVPSLISSGSTAISSAHARAPSSSRSFAPRSTSSSLSLSSATEHRHKRSSIVSFSRFVGGPFAERPRIALEPGKRWQTPLEVEDPKRLKASRLSRILKFWKPKETRI